MRAVLCKANGDPSTLTVEDIDNQPPGPGEARVAVHACGVNFLDTLIIEGKYQEKPPFPFIPGGEIAGEVMDVGDGVTNVRPGDRVMGICQTGGYAEEATVPAGLLMPIPDGMDYPEAAAFPLAYGTSHIALEHRGRLTSSETLLVLGAAGGVGLSAVQIGKVMGATVIAAASTDAKLKVAADNGADYTINYVEEDLRERVKKLTGGRGVNVVYDPVGGDLFDQAVRCVGWEGRLLVIGFASGRIPEFPVNLAMVKNFSLVGVYWGAYSQKNPAVLIGSLMQLVAWYTEGKLKPHVSATYPLNQFADAMNALTTRASTGKVVILTRE
jgi:NADPH2:quinone reductase